MLIQKAFDLFIFGFSVAFTKARPSKRHNCIIQAAALPEILQRKGSPDDKCPKGQNLTPGIW